jgi:hypothetical protein
MCEFCVQGFLFPHPHVAMLQNIYLFFFSVCSSIYLKPVATSNDAMSIGTKYLFVHFLSLFIYLFKNLLHHMCLLSFLLIASGSLQHCSCDFAALMYVELWCEEQFNRLALGPPDFSHEESVRPLFISPDFF